jgi:hypothetical protein
MVRKGKVTTNPEEIQNWVISRSGYPAIGKRIHGSEVVTELCIHFSDEQSFSSVKPISWDEFFQKFQEEKLVFLYQEKTHTGEVSRSCVFL